MTRSRAAFRQRRSSGTRRIDNNARRKKSSKMPLPSAAHSADTSLKLMRWWLADQVEKARTNASLISSQSTKR